MHLQQTNIFARNIKMNLFKIDDTATFQKYEYLVTAQDQALFYY